MKKIIPVLALLLSGCTTLMSVGDRTRLLWHQGKEIDSAETPPQFVVSVQEIHSVIPLTKYCWSIYADDHDYYLSPGIQKLSSSSGDNSYLARKNGIRVDGRDRTQFEEILKIKGSDTWVSVGQLRSTMKE